MARPLGKPPMKGAYAAPKSSLGEALKKFIPSSTISYTRKPSVQDIVNKNAVPNAPQSTMPKTTAVKRKAGMISNGIGVGP